MLRDSLPDYQFKNLLYRSDFTTKVNRGQSYVSFEYLDLTLSSGNLCCRIISINRPPSTLKK